MRSIDNCELKNINGGDSQSFWEMAGEWVGNLFAESAYSQNSRQLHRLNSEGGLNEYLESQSDPLL